MSLRLVGGMRSLGEIVEDIVYGVFTLLNEEVRRLGTIWGLLENDLHHGGELSFQLGAQGLAAVEL